MIIQEWFWIWPEIVNVFVIVYINLLVNMDENVLETKLMVYLYFV